ncbi:MAG: hypothetical protein ACI9BW_004008 [Gammaproteobacteria bacterium]
MLCKLLTRQSGSTKRLTVLIAIAVFLIPLSLSADQAKPHGAAFRTLFGDTLEREFNIGIMGYAHISAAKSNHDISKTLLPQGRGRGLQPQGGLVQDEGINLQHIGLIVCKGSACPPGHLFEPNRNVLSRVTPLPGPRGDEIIVDWAVTAHYGEDGVFWSTKGFDDWAWNAKDKNRLALTEFFLDIYLPIGAGASVVIGSWHTSLALEIGKALVPPNMFSSRTYAFTASPAKHVGILTQFKLPLDPALGHASLGFGITSDWNSVDFGSGAGGPSFMFTGRWRSPDMRTWIDIETIFGNGEDDFGDSEIINGVAYPRGGGSQFLALSSSNAYLERFVGYLTATHTASERLILVFESVYGYQQGGDLRPLPFAITRDSAFYGANGGFRYRLVENVHLGARFEWFTDENAANVLWSGVGATGGDVYALTASLSWQPSKHLLIRPELKYDVYDGKGHLFAAGSNGLAQHDAQLLGVLNFEFRF